MYVLKQVDLARMDKVGDRKVCNLCENLWKGAGLMSKSVVRAAVSCQEPSSSNITLPVNASPREGACGTRECIPYPDISKSFKADGRSAKLVTTCDLLLQEQVDVANTPQLSACLDLAGFQSPE